MSKRLASNTGKRAQLLIDGLNAGSVVLDRYGHAWQLGGIGSVGIYWYRAYGDDSRVSSWDLAQIGHPFKVVHEA